MRKLLALFRGRTAAAPPAPPETAPERPPVLDDLRAFIRREVAGGFCDDDVVLRNAVEVYDDKVAADVLRDHAQAFLREALRDHRAAQDRWPDETDCDRLDAAFDALEAQGIVARQNFACCDTCGATDIAEEMAEIEADGITVRGYAYFHAQDTDAAVDGEMLYLSYGAVDDDDDASSLAIGRLVAGELARHGLEILWSGAIDQRIGVAIDWKRRR